jgi:hypothetical protein
MKTSEILRAGYDNLLVDGWGQHAYELPGGEMCMEGAVMCIRVALDKQTAAHDYLQKVVNALNVTPRWQTVPQFNDHPDRTFDEVLDVYQQAIKLAEADEASTS